MRIHILPAIRLAVPATLIFIGMLVLTGCFFIPAFNATVKGTNVAAKVGDARSGRPIRVGVATRQQIESMFGPPEYQNDAARRIGYTWNVKAGTWVSLICFTAGNEIHARAISLDFDEAGVLRRFKFYSSDDRGLSDFLQEMQHPLDP